MNVAIFSSRTGSDGLYIQSRQKELNIETVQFVTNNPQSPLLVTNSTAYLIPDRPNMGDYWDVLGACNDYAPIDYIFLMGYLRIFPRKICEKYKVYNLHPGNIVAYPQLKGFDPHEKAYKLRLPTTGIVIHEVVAEADSGKIVYCRTCEIDYTKGVDQLYSRLGKIAKEAWFDFIKTLTP